MNENRFYTLEEEQTMRFYQMPKALFNNERYKGLSLEAKATYSILRDRQDLSVKNGWADNQGFIFSYYTVVKLCEILEVANGKVNTIKKDLVKYGLIIDKRQGQGKPNKIYVLKPECDESYFYDKKSTATTIGNTKTCENRTSKDVKIARLDMRKSHTNDTELKDTNLSDTKNHSIIKERNQQKKEIQNKQTPKDDGLNELINNLELSSLETKDKAPVLQSIKVLYSSNKGITSSGISVKPSEIRENLNHLQYKHIEQGLKDYQEASNRSQITNPTAYLGSCIYNAIFKPDTKKTTYRDNVKPVNTKFHNFEQRTSKYSAEELEKMVLKRK